MRNYITPRVQQQHLDYMSTHVVADFERGLLFVDGIQSTEPTGKKFPYATIYIPVKPQLIVKRSHVIWFLKTNIWPTLIIDHRNKIKSDDRFDNLRHVTHSTNMLNRNCSLNRDLPPGIYHTGSKNKKYKASIFREGKADVLGSFESLDEALEVLESARKDYNLESII